MSDELIVTAVDILTNPPPGVDMTLVGGQALIYWTLVYQSQYPDFFPDDVISSTYDIDFVITMKKACEECHKHWGGKLLMPEADDMTPELGVLVFNEDTDDELEIDLLQDLIKLSREKILKERQLIRDDDSRFENLYVLSEWAVLLNRTYNTVSLSKYQNDEGFRQVRNACAVYKAMIQHYIDCGDIRKAQSKCNQVIKLAENSRFGIPLFLNFGIDLLDTMPEKSDKFTPVFIEKALIPGLERVQNKRERIKTDRVRRSSSKIKK